MKLDNQPIGAALQCVPEYIARWALTVNIPAYSDVCSGGHSLYLKGRNQILQAHRWGAGRGRGLGAAGCGLGVGARGCGQAGAGGWGLRAGGWGLGVGAGWGGELPGGGDSR